MNTPEQSAAGDSPSSRRELQLQGPRPPPLRVSKESHKIRKPPLHPHQLAQAPANANQQRQPLVIFDISPKVIHATVDNFMYIVQRYTGLWSGDEARSGGVSPAARLASIEKTSPSEKERGNSGGDVMGMLEMEGIEVGQFPGILSPAPTTLPPISAGLFSPVIDPQAFAYLNELSPFWSGNSFIPSPSALLSAPIVSPIHSPDIFKNFIDF